MKKVIFALLTITSLLVSTYSFVNRNNEFAIAFFQSESQITVNIDLAAEDGGSVSEEMILHLNEFSQKHDISIAQFIGFWDLNVTVHMTNIENNPNIQLIQGEYPSETFHISNQRYSDLHIRQSGQFFFPVSNWNIRIYEMEEMRNIGFLGTLHLINANEEIALLFIEEFSVYGDIILAEDVWFESHIQIFRDQATWTDTSLESFIIASPFTMAIIFSMMILFVGTVFFVFQNRSKLIIEYLWGHTHFYSFYKAPQPFVIFYLIITGVICASFGAVLVFNQAWDHMMIHLSRIIVVNLFIWLSFWLFLVVGVILVRKYRYFSEKSKKNIFSEKVQVFSFLLKILISTIVFLVFLSTTSNLFDLREEFDQLSYWQQAENIFLIQAAIVGDGNGLWETERLVDELGNEIEFLRLSDFERMQEREESLRQLFLLLEDHNDAFLFEGNAFFRIYENWESPVRGNWMYAYEIDQLEREEWWLPYILENREEVDPLLIHLVESGVFELAQRSIYLSSNYLEKNPILAVNGQNVLDLIIDDSYTLNVLVPKHYQSFEEDLIDYFRSQFYIDRIDLVNWYNEELGLPLLEVTIEDLIVNIIYTKDNQSYFSFNRNIGDEYSQIWDPIAVIHNNDISVSSTSARVMNSLYFTNEYNIQALEAIRPLLEEVGTNEVQSVISIFEQGNENLIQIQWQIFRQVLSLIMVGMFLLITCMVMMWAHYSLNANRINIDYLFGSSYWDRHQEMIFFAATANCLGGVIILFFNGFSWLLIFFAVLLSALDMIIISLLGKFLTKKNIAVAIKGREL